MDDADARHARATAAEQASAINRAVFASFLAHRPGATLDKAVLHFECPGGVDEALSLEDFAARHGRTAEQYRKIYVIDYDWALRQHAAKMTVDLSERLAAHDLRHAGPRFAAANVVTEGDVRRLTETTVLELALTAAELASFAALCDEVKRRRSELEAKAAKTSLQPALAACGLEVATPTCCRHGLTSPAQLTAAPDWLVASIDAERRIEVAPYRAYPTSEVGDDFRPTPETVREWRDRQRRRDAAKAAALRDGPLEGYIVEYELEGARPLLKASGLDSPIDVLTASAQTILALRLSKSAGMGRFEAMLTRMRADGHAARLLAPPPPPAEPLAALPRAHEASPDLLALLNRHGMGARHARVLGCRRVSDLQGVDTATLLLSRFTKDELGRLGAVLREAGVKQLS